jgi:hypothetical protein
MLAKKRKGDAFIQKARVIVDVHRRNAARSRLACMVGLAVASADPRHCLTC